MKAHEKHCGIVATPPIFPFTRPGPDMDEEREYLAFPATPPRRNNRESLMVQIGVPDDDDDEDEDEKRKTTRMLLHRRRRCQRTGSEARSSPRNQTEREMRYSNFEMEDEIKEFPEDEGGEGFDEDHDAIIGETHDPSIEEVKPQDTHEFIHDDQENDGRDHRLEQEISTDGGSIGNQEQEEEVFQNEEVYGNENKYYEGEENPSSTGSAVHLLILISSFGCTHHLPQQRCLMILEECGYDFETIDGSLHKDLRNYLWGVSGLRGVYPQCFVVRGDRVFYVGDKNAIEGINDASQMSEEILESNAGILTWERLMAFDPGEEDW